MKKSGLVAALLIGAAPAALAAQSAPAPLPPPPPAAGPAPSAPAPAAAVPRPAPSGQRRRPAPAPPPADAADEEDAIVVTGRPLPGAVIGNIPPEVTLNQGDIRAYGVSNVNELLQELAPQTGSGQGRGGEAPVVLLNGRRISSFREIRDVPTEAIQRVEILPAEVALRYGYAADQRVVNIVLRRFFRAITTEDSAGIATRGGGESGSAEANLLHIRRDTRLNLDVKYQTQAALRESQRDIVPTPPRFPFDFAGNVTAASGLPGAEIDPALSAAAGRPVTVAGVPDLGGRAPMLGDFAGTANLANPGDIARYRTLRPATDQLALNAVVTRPILGDVTATLNASFEANGSESLSGLPGVRLLVPAGNPFSPFGTAVAVDRYVPGTPLRQRVAAETAHLGLTLLGDLNPRWHWSLTANYDRVDTRTSTIRGVDPSALQAAITAGSPGVNPFGPLLGGDFGPLLIDRAHALSNSGNLQIVVNGALAELPAGQLSTTVKLGGEALGFATDSLRGGVAQAISLSRDNANAQVTLDIPLTSRRNHFLDAIGDLSANFNFAANRLSDFGTITTLGYGLTWKPLPNVTLLWSMTDQEGAPTVQQLGNPEVVTPGVPVFDYVNGRTVFVTRREGGNPGLDADRRHILKFGLNASLLSNPQLSLIGEFVRIRTDNAIASLPAATAALETAFPDRFQRDAEGELVAIDARPVNFARERRTQLRWGFNLSVPLRASAAQQQRLRDSFREIFLRRRAQFAPRAGAPDGDARAGPPAPPPAGGDAQSPAPPGAPRRPGGGFGGFGGREGGGGFGGRGGFGGGRGGGEGGFGGPGGIGSGRLQLAVFHTWIFRDDILIRPGAPLLDLLDGAATGSSGGQPRHKIEVNGGVTRNGLGFRINGTWQSGTRVEGGTPASGATGDLFFSDLATLNLRLFADFSQIGTLARRSWARGLRLTLSVNNVFDSHERVRDATGATPLSYQPDYLDPLGREVRLTVRKLFF